MFGGKFGGNGLPDALSRTRPTLPDEAARGLEPASRATSGTSPLDRAFRDSSRVCGTISYMGNKRLAQVRYAQ